MDRTRVFVWQFRDASSTRQLISLKISTKIIFDLSQWQQNHNTINTDKKKLPFLLSCWQHFAGILPLSQWLCRKSTTSFMSRRMRRHFSPVNTCDKVIKSRICERHGDPCRWPKGSRPLGTRVPNKKTWRLRTCSRSGKETAVIFNVD